ncbi:hypothetical protein CASFOL_031327 [Castilleja foliolosa]|uniref:histone acetyltransferase n=1 Tax=Castilleja foliolosa TaxID=1961234 RepID=A0ABD3C4Z5_9LAMI
MTIEDGLSKEIITRHLKTSDHPKNEGELCAVCLDDLSRLNKKMIIGTLDCGHEYHKSCIKKWLTRKNCCPLCKATGISVRDKLRKVLELLVHTPQCHTANCQYQNCRKLRGLFKHGMECKVRASGGCELCKKMWNLLQLHARACKESECNVPRCRDLKEHLRREHAHLA